MVRFWERDGCLGGKLDLVCIIYILCRRFSVVHLVSPLNHIFPFWWFSDPFLWKFVERIWRSFLCGFVEGFTREYLETLFLVILPLKSVEKSFDSVVLGWTRGEVFLRFDFRLLLIWWVLGLDLLATRCPWGTPSSPKFCCNPLGESGDRVKRSWSSSRGSLFQGRVV